MRIRSSEMTVAGQVYNLCTWIVVQQFIYFSEQNSNNRATNNMQHVATDMGSFGLTSVDFCIC